MLLPGVRFSQRNHGKLSGAIWWKVKNYFIWANSGISRSSEQLIVCWPGWLSGKSTGQLNTYGQSGLGSNPTVGRVKCKTKTRGFTDFLFKKKKFFLKFPYCPWYPKPCHFSENQHSPRAPAHHQHHMTTSSKVGLLTFQSITLVIRFLSHFKAF